MIVSPHANSDRPRGDHGLVPLINVVFLLLAFFMIAGQIQRADLVRVDPPVSISESVPTERRTEVVVDRDGTVYVEGESVELESLADVIESARGPDATLDLVLAHQQTMDSILVKADADLEVAKLEAVLTELMRAGVSRAALATTPNSR